MFWKNRFQQLGIIRAYLFIPHIIYALNHFKIKKSYWTKNINFTPNRQNVSIQILIVILIIIFQRKCFATKTHNLTISINLVETKLDEGWPWCSGRVMVKASDGLPVRQQLWCADVIQNAVQTCLEEHAPIYCLVSEIRVRAKELLGLWVWLNLFKVASSIRPQIEAKNVDYMNELPPDPRGLLLLCSRFVFLAFLMSFGYFLSYCRSPVINPQQQVADSQERCGRIDLEKGLWAKAGKKTVSSIFKITILMSKNNPRRYLHSTFECFSVYILCQEYCLLL